MTKHFPPGRSANMKKSNSYSLKCADQFGAEHQETAAFSECWGWQMLNEEWDATGRPSLLPIKASSADAAQFNCRKLSVTPLLSKLYLQSSVREMYFYLFFFSSALICSLTSLIFSKTPSWSSGVLLSPLWAGSELLECVLESLPNDRLSHKR